MGTKTRQRSPSKIALMKDKKPTTVEPNSAQIIKQPRQKKKKRSKKKRSKSQRPHLTVHGRSCSIHSLDSKGLPSEGQESPTELCCSNEDTGNASSETDNLGETHNAKLGTEKKRITLRKERTEPSEKPKDVSNSRENKKKIKYPNVVEKRKYQTVSEFQFVYPGKSNFHSLQENTKQNLRSIYQAKVEPKPPRSTQLSCWMPHHQWDIRKSQRGNATPDANCPVGNDFLRKNPTQALRSLTYKINKLVLVNENDLGPTRNTPSAPTVNSYFPHLQHNPVSEKTGPLTEAFQRSKRRSAKREDRVEQQPPVEAWSKLRGFPAPLRNSPRLRPVSAKEHHEKATDQMLARKRNPNVKLAGKGRGDLNRPGVDTDGIPQTKSAIIIPTVSRYLSSENLSAKGTPLGWKTVTQFLAEKNVAEGIPINGSQGELGSSSFSAASGTSPKDETSNTGADEPDRAEPERDVKVGDAGDLEPGSNATE
ncbi:uncharacterized protein LOC117670268 [Pantherophis guttatus]|uniref:Uncharacterized protein LOC117670268 n=1 Tax=Pantherophis guttatus TaxID=94885 RepID=A0A6P9CQ44_PANGU|nr:uncharacterized protein LOC117670268 [Pantherophis guttatus]